MKRVFIIVWLVAIFSCISYIFWYNDLQYNLPTPVPEKYDPVKQGERVSLKGKMDVEQDKPLLIHFFNPDCPCSRFNIKHVQTLVRHYKDKMAFAVVVLSKTKEYTEEEIQDKFGLDVPVSFDASIADICGVYATPQAVILDADQNLYYRGNYNKSRYCTDKETNYAQMAIDSLLTNDHYPAFSASALKAYGCTLPVCTK